MRESFPFRKKKKKKTGRGGNIGEAKKGREREGKRQAEDINGKTGRKWEERDGELRKDES